MKIKATLFAASLLFLSGIILKAQSLYENNFYYYKGGKVPLKFSTKKIVIGFKSNISFKEKRYVFDKIKVIKSSKDKNSVIENTDILHIQLADKLSAEQVKQTLRQLEASSAVRFANPYFYSEEGIYLTCTDKIIVELRKDTDYSRFEELIHKMGIEIQEKYRFANHTYILKVLNPASLNTLKAANQLFESGYFVYSDPDFQGDVQEGTVPNDYYYAQYQWGLNNTGQYNGTAGIDINMQAAWDITTGCPSIRVAVIDNGVDLGHPDLQANMDPGYDAIQDQPGGGYIAEDDIHGTPCAGIIAATANNNEGIAGIAHFCRILPVRAYSSGYGSTEFFVRAIDWAWKNGADVINNSYGWSKSDAFDKAIERATVQGRNGLGCIFAASSMNGNISTVSYPARNPFAIAVGAVNMCGERKSKTSCDGDTTWGSNYGEALDAMTPGQLIMTTDIYGSGGYNIANYCLFSGTSAACPHVAGVAALVLSVNPTLKASEAKAIIESTCKKLPNYTYTAQQGYANGTWNNETGYGMVDAFEAVKKAGTVYIQNKSISESTYRGVFIHAGSNVTPTLPQGPVTTAANTATAYLAAHGSIFLKPGVHIKSGSKFSATIDTTMYKNQCVAQNLPPVPVINPNPPNDLVTLSDNQSDVKTVSNEQESDLSEVFSVYPNPFGDELNLHFETEGGPVSFVLRDAAGRSFTLLENKTFARGRHTLRPDISQLPPGVYIYTFSEGGRNRSGKLLKSR